MKEKQTDYKKLVSRKGNEYYFVDYIFEHSDSFQGAVGSILVPISKKEYKERTSSDNLIEYFRDIWLQAVEERTTEQSLRGWAKEVYEIDGDNAIFDLSYSGYWKQLRNIGLTKKEYPIFECAGGGRCFSKENSFDEIYDKELLQKIKKVEK